jgi:hypothetical protein
VNVRNILLLAEENLQLKYSLGTPDREGVISVEK